MAENITVDARTFASVMKDIIDEYGEEVNDIIREVVEDEADETVKDLRSNTQWPKYSKSWTKRPEIVAGVQTSFVVYNAKHYRLTHLLEKGHQSYNQYGGSYKFVSARPHIAMSEQRAIERLERKIRERIERG